MEQPRDRMRFSVIVPAYNEAAYLGRALDSLLHQDYNGRYEVIVVDNNSTDGTAAIAAQYGVPVVKEPQQGVCAARQRGVDCARARSSSPPMPIPPNPETGCVPSMLASPSQRGRRGCRSLPLSRSLMVGQGVSDTALRVGGQGLRADWIRVLCERDQHRCPAHRIPGL